MSIDVVERSGERTSSSTTRTWIALALVYVIWGSTYLAIRIGVAPTVGRGIPPLILAGIRFTIAGVVLLGLTWNSATADRTPDPIGKPQWIAAAIVGIALPGGNGLVSIGERHVDSGTAALVIASMPIIAAVFAATIGRDRFTVRRTIGLAIGLGGVAVLSTAGSPGGHATSGHVFGIGSLLAAAVLWSAGTVYAGTAQLPKRPLVSTGMEMLIGGIALLVVAAATGEFSQLHIDAVPARSFFALGYLIVFGSMVGYTAYAWLLANAPLSLTTTYAYINPIVAVILGALILSEPFGVTSAVATLLVVGGVVLTIGGKR